MQSLRPPVRAFWHRYLIALGLAFSVTVMGIVGVNLGIDQKLGSIRRVHHLKLPNDPGSSGNFLVIGSDSRAFVDNSQEAQAFGSAQTQTGQRSDTIMIVHVEPDQKRSFLVSIPRDTWVDIPGVGHSKINAAFNYGPQKTIDTINQNFGVKINHYIEINFTAFEGIVKAIGNVPVYFPAPARDTYTGLSVYVAGCAHLDGPTALKYVRMRSVEFYEDGKWVTDPRADLDRIQRQQDFIRRLASIAFRKAINNPLTASDIADRVVGKLQADDQLSRGDIFKLVNTFRKVDPNNPQAVEMTTLPTTRAFHNGQDAQDLQQPDAEQILARLRTFGTPPGAAPSVHPSDVHLRVLNGSGATGVAANTMSQLQQYGFLSSGTGNHEHLAVTEVHYLPKGLDRAKLVQSYLGGTGRLVEDSTLANADVEVIIGRDFKGIVPPTGAQAVTTTTTAAAQAKGTKGSRSATPKVTAPPDPAAACK